MVTPKTRVTPMMRNIEVLVVINSIPTDPANAAPAANRRGPRTRWRRETGMETIAASAVIGTTM
jgi:hypothetical protein